MRDFAAVKRPSGKSQFGGDEDLQLKDNLPAVAERMYSAKERAIYAEIEADKRFPTNKIYREIWLDGANWSPKA